jgi:hypothetical protein
MQTLKTTFLMGVSCMLSIIFGLNCDAFTSLWSRSCACACAVRCAALCCAVAVLCCGMCCAVLCCAVLCCAVLCCAVLCCAVLCCAVLCCAVLVLSLCCAVLCCAVLCCAVAGLVPLKCPRWRTFLCRSFFVFFEMLLLDFHTSISIQVSPSMGGETLPIVVFKDLLVKSPLLSHFTWLILPNNHWASTASSGKYNDNVISLSDSNFPWGRPSLTHLSPDKWAKTPLPSHRS